MVFAACGTEPTLKSTEVLESGINLDSPNIADGADGTNLRAAIAVPATKTPCTLDPDAKKIDSAATCGRFYVPIDHNDTAYSPKISVGYEFYPALSSASGTLVIVEGGPGYSTTFVRDEILETFRSLRANRNIMLFDRRGTGVSSAIRCNALQTFKPSLTPIGAEPVDLNSKYLQAVKSCGDSLNSKWKYDVGPNKNKFVHASDLFGTGNAVEDLADILAVLKLGPIDLYGDSYGTQFAQSFSARNPALVRSLVLDSALPVSDNDPNSNPLDSSAVSESLTALNLACVRSDSRDSFTGELYLTCNQLGLIKDRINKLYMSLATPIKGSFTEYNKTTNRSVSRFVTIDRQALLQMVTNPGTDATSRLIYRDLLAAASAWLDNNDSQPLLRLYVETNPDRGSGVSDESTTTKEDPSLFSSGAYSATICNDDKPAFTPVDDLSVRLNSFNTNVSNYTPIYDPFPFTKIELAHSRPGAFDTVTAYGCLTWPSAVPSHFLSPLGGKQPNQRPALILSGDLDTATTPSDALAVRDITGGTLVTLPNTVHVARSNPRNVNSNCAVEIISQFLNAPTGSAIRQNSF
jgi:pimeloyl-ACP methyl ester carboxylesterase